MMTTANTAVTRYSIILTIAKDGAIMATHSNPRVQELFGTDTLPTPYFIPLGMVGMMATRIKAQAQAHISRLNPGVNVVWGRTLTESY